MWKLIISNIIVNRNNNDDNNNNNNNNHKTKFYNLVPLPIVIPFDYFLPLELIPKNILT